MTAPRTAPAILADNAPWGCFVSLIDGIAIYDPTGKVPGGILKRPPGAPQNEGSAGEQVMICTDGPIMGLFPDGGALMVEGSRRQIRAGSTYYVSLFEGRIIGWIDG